MDSNRKKRKNLLSIDGGVSGLPALYILNEMLSRLQFDLNLEDELLPYQHFDMIIATGTGVLVAILIGKLRLTASKSIDVYLKLSTVIPFKPAKDDAERKRNTEAFQKIFKEILEDNGLSADTPMLDNTGPKLVLCNIDINNASALHPIRSYRSRGSPAPPCTVLQAACASIASPDTFIPVTIGNEHAAVTLINALAGFANPTKELLREAQRVFGNDTEISTILSLGAGKGDIWDMSELKDALEMGEMIKQINTNCEPVHQELYARLRGTGVYFRLNVERESGARMKLTSARVSAYLLEGAVNDKVDEAVKSIHHRPAGINLEDINSVRVINPGLRPRPSLVRNFVGREDILAAMSRSHISSRSTWMDTPVITVLSGIGGSGKTQTALKFVREFERTYPDAPVFFLNASSKDTLKTDLETFIRSQGTTHRAKSFEDALVYLAKDIDNWLMVLDNADDPSVRLFPFIPKCGHGNVIVTTRNSNHGILSPDGTYHVEGLSLDDATKLILSISNNEHTDSNRTIARDIVSELGCLPLAVAQAGGYIYVNKRLSTYLGMYRSNQAELLDLDEVQLPQDYRATVATTIKMSMDQLPPEAQDLMRLFAHLDAISIAHEIIAMAAGRKFRYVERTPEADLDSRTLEQAEALMNIFCPNGQWAEVGFGKLIYQCLQYSLLRLTTQNDAKFYSMHILVQSYLQTTTSSIQNLRPEHLVVRLLGSTITLDSQYKYLALNRMLAPHLRIVDTDDVVEAGDCTAFAETFYEAGKPKLAVAYGERGVEVWKTLLGDQNWKTLSAMENLAIAYWKMGDPQKAVEIEEKILEIRKELYGMESEETLRTMANLAASYSDVGRDQEALKIEEEVMAAQKRVLGLEHPDTLRTMSNLANSYITAGRPQEAAELAEQVLDTQKNRIGLEHPDTIRTMRNLALSYRKIGRSTEALEIERTALMLQTQLMGAENPDTLFAMRRHLTTLRSLQMMDDMHKLLQVAVPAHERSLGRDHPETVKLKERYKEEISSIGS